MMNFSNFPTAASIPAQTRGRAACISIALACKLVSAATTVNAGEPSGWLLDVDFENQPPGQPIGTGGAALGQPTFVSTFVDAIVRDAPMASRSLEITWNTAPETASGIRFGLLGGVEASANLLSITLDLHAHVASRYYVFIREATTAAQSFGGLHLTQDGIAALFDASGSQLVAHDLAFGQTRRLRWDYDLDARTYAFSLDGERLVEGRPHGVPDNGRGIGTIRVELDWNTPLDTAISVDNLRVFASTDALFTHESRAPEHAPCAILESAAALACGRSHCRCIQRRKIETNLSPPSGRETYRELLPALIGGERPRSHVAPVRAWWCPRDLRHAREYRHRARHACRRSRCVRARAPARSARGL